MIHEVLHLKSAEFNSLVNADSGLSERMLQSPHAFGQVTAAKALKEGITELLTLEVAGETETPLAYSSHVELARGIEALVGREVLLDAYFNADPESYQKVIDALDGLPGKLSESAREDLSGISIEGGIGEEQQVEWFKLASYLNYHADGASEQDPLTSEERGLFNAVVDQLSPDDTVVLDDPEVGNKTKADIIKAAFGRV